MVQNKLALLAATFITLAAVAQPTKQTAAPVKSNQHLKVFNMAMASGDGNTAVTALNYYLSEKGENNIYADTLAMIYMQQGNFGQCYYWSDKRLKIKPDDNTLLEMKGVSLDKLGQAKEAITLFENLFAKTKNPYHAYKLMEMQYGIKRLAECLATAQAAEKLEYKPDFLMTYNVGQQTGRTYLQAGVFNIHALALYDLDKKADAKTYFEKALALDSTFALAKQNLDAIHSLETGGKIMQPAAGQPSAFPANKQN